ncbi:MAG: ABC transporter permease subunit, partial [Anaerolineae bacterium]
GMLVGSLARTTKQAGSIGLLLGFALYFASGILGFTINPAAGVAQANVPTEGFRFYLSQLTPHTYAVGGYYKLMLEGAGLADIWPNILILFGFGVVFFLIGLWRFKYE